jgi:hypothetical protein
MTSAQRSLMGFAKQIEDNPATHPKGKGNPTVTDGDFNYLLFTRGAAGVQNMTIPLDMEVGGGAMLRDVVKVGVTSGGQMEFIPRPESLGVFLMGALGKDTPSLHAGGTLANDHAFTMPTDQFDAPYYTVRFSPGGMWGEQYQDCRISMLGLSWRGANFVRGQLAFAGGKPTPGVAMTTWSAAAQTDATPPFITPISTITLPSSGSVKVLSGSFQSTMAIPLDEQWIVGSYNPDDFDIVSRAYVLQLALKITDVNLYNKVVYDGLGAVTEWTSEILKQADFDITFKTAQYIEGTTPYSLTIEGNGGAAGAGNVAWSAQPVGLRAGSQVIMAVAGIFLADATEAIKVTLTNSQATPY